MMELIAYTRVPWDVRSYSTNGMTGSAVVSLLDQISKDVSQPPDV